MLEIPIYKIQTNNGQIEGLPKNPRFIKDRRFAALKQSIRDFPEMLSLREIVVFPLENVFVCIGGNMRFRACKDLGYKKIPAKVLPADFPVSKLREFAIKDNIAFGEDDFDILANEFEIDELIGFGLELPKDFLLIDEPDETPAPPPEIITAKIITCPNCDHAFSITKENKK